MNFSTYDRTVGCNVAPSVCIRAKWTKVCVSIFYPRADASFPLLPPFLIQYIRRSLFRSRTLTLVDHFVSIFHLFLLISLLFTYSFPFVMEKDVKMQKKIILNSQWWAKHLFAGQTTQYLWFTLMVPSNRCYAVCSKLFYFYPPNEKRQLCNEIPKLIARCQTKHTCGKHWF